MKTEATNQADDKSAWSLGQWLTYLEQLHPSEIDLGLTRIRAVYQCLNLSFKNKTIVTVAGTNGKGSTCAVLETLALKAGKQTAVYSSPHLLDYRERVRLNGELPDEKAFCTAFLAVDGCRGDVSLTYFEFGTLAALYMIANARCDIALLEVGLGGRLDAVNLVDADIAVITSVDLDHQAWLGDNREDIGREKAGIFRSGIPIVIGDPQPPASVVSAATQSSEFVLRQNKDFTFEGDHEHWQWRSDKETFKALPMVAVPVQNVSTALAVWQLLNLELAYPALCEALASVALPGRCQIVSQSPTVMLDVAHNPQACRYLADKIMQMSPSRVHLVVAMLADKDIAQSLAPLMAMPMEKYWYAAGLDIPRGAASEVIKGVLVGQQKVLDCQSVHEGLTRAKAMVTEPADSDERELVVVFGSFFTVAEALQA